jgi:hypothetical protein
MAFGAALVRRAKFEAQCLDDIEFTPRSPEPARVIPGRKD